MNRYLVEVQIITLAYVMAASPEEAVAKVKERYGNIDEPESGMDIVLEGDETSPLEPTNPQAPDTARHADGGADRQRRLPGN